MQNAAQIKESGVTATASNIDPGKPLAGRTALVTGSGQNIAKAIALHFARAGANSKCALAKSR